MGTCQTTHTHTHTQVFVATGTLRPAGSAGGVRGLCKSVPAAAGGGGWRPSVTVPLPPTPILEGSFISLSLSLSFSLSPSLLYLTLPPSLRLSLSLRLSSLLSLSLSLTHAHTHARTHILTQYSYSHNLFCPSLSFDL